MLFASEDLAVRIERAEAAMIAEAARRTAQRRPDAGAFAEPLGGGFAVFTETGSPLTKVVGVGFGGAVDEGALCTVETAYGERGCPVRFEVSTLAEPTVFAQLTGRGYGLVGFENVLGRSVPADAPVPAEDDLEIDRIEAEAIGTWLDVVATGFAAPDERGVPPDEVFPRDVLERVLDEFARVPGMATYLALRDGEPAGGASMRISGGVALLCGAATLPAHRRRGIQAALLARRLADAAGAGCDVAVVTTQPASTSQQNVQRKGFELLYSRAVLVRQ